MTTHNNMPAVQTCLAYTGVAEEAARHYVDVIPGATIERVSKSGDGEHIVAVNIKMGEQRILCLNADLGASFSQAMNLVLLCPTQECIDAAWAGLSADGDGMCGWTTDRFGVSWQIVPDQLGEWMSGPNGTAVQEALMRMTKLDYETLKQASSQSK